MLELGAKVDGNNGKKFPLIAACSNKHVSVVQLLLTHGADPNILEENKLPMHMAVVDDNIELVELPLLLKHGANIDVVNTNGMTALHRAIEYYQYRSNARATSSRYSQKVMASSNTKSVLDILLENKADVNIVDTCGETQLYRAASKGLLDVVRKMLQVYGGNPNKGSPDKNPLTAAVTDCNTEVVQLLLKYGAKIDVADTNRNTALHYAVEHYRYCQTSPPRATTSRYSVLCVLLENKADVNTVNNSGETPLYKAVSRGLLDVVSKMLQVYEGNPNKGAPEKSPLTAACLMQNVEHDMLLKHEADPNLASTSCARDADSKRKVPLFVAVDKDNSNILKSLLNAGASVNAMNHEGRSIVCFAVEKLTSSRYCQSTEEIEKRLSPIRLLVEHGANLNISDGHSPLYLVVTALAEARISRGDVYRTGIIELLQLMAKHGVMLLDDVCGQSLNSGTLKALVTFDGKHELIVDLFRAGAGFQLIAFCCNAVAPRTGPALEAKSIRLCQAAILAGYSPTAEELHNLQLDAVRQNAAHDVLEQLVNWFNEDRQQVSSLLRQCRVVVRRLLSVAVHYQTILPAIDELETPNIVKLYLQFDGPMSEVDLSVKKGATNP